MNEYIRQDSTVVFYEISSISIRLYLYCSKSQPKHLKAFYTVRSGPYRFTEKIHQILSRGRRKINSDPIKTANSTMDIIKGKSESIRTYYQTEHILHPLTRLKGELPKTNYPQCSTWTTANFLKEPWKTVCFLQYRST